MTDSRAASPDRYPLVLLGLYLAFWTTLAIAPHYREDWLLENVLVVIALPLLVWSHRRIGFSRYALTALFVFFSLHVVGAHYTYSEVPWNAGLKALTGWDAMQSFGLQRNPFDRVVHFSYGLLIVPAVAELIDARGPLRGIWRQLVPIMFIMSNSELYEMIEWQAAETFGGDLGQAYLGTQGDIWDAQKDSLMAMVGAILGLTIYRWLYRAKTPGHSIKDDKRI
jgi:putative membrane protein